MILKDGSHLDDSRRINKENYMHKERVQDIRDIMASLIGANRTYMLNWQCPSDGITFATNLDEFHKCGNTACFAGTLALSPMFQREGGRVGNRGRPEFF